MAIPVSTLLPGLLVHVNTSIKGNVTYDKGEERITNQDGTEVSEWTTERTIIDVAEQKRATEVRSKARNLVVAVCVATEHGLLCPVAKREVLDNAFDDARKLVVEFNASAKTTRLKFNALAGYIAPDDLSAVRAINGEVRDLLAEMSAGIEALDVERVRDAAKRTKKIGNMLAPEMQARIETVVKTVRDQAKKLVEAGEQAATAIDAATLNSLTAARTAFLDLEEAAPVGDAADTSARTLDLAPHLDPAAPAPAKVPELDIG